MDKGEEVEVEVEAERHCGTASR
jgi:hypothetical protein